MAERPVGISIIFGFTPTSNLNQGTDNATLYGIDQISADSRPIAGWSESIGLGSYVRGNIGASGHVKLDWRAQRHEYSIHYTAETETEMGLTFAKTVPSGDFGTRIFHVNLKRDQGDCSSTGISFSGGYTIDQGRGINGTLRFSELKNKANTGENALRTLIDLGYSRTPDPAFALRLGIQAEHADADRATLGHTSLAATAQASKAFRGGYEISTQVPAGQRRLTPTSDLPARMDFPSSRSRCSTAASASAALCQNSHAGWRRIRQMWTCSKRPSAPAVSPCRAGSNPPLNRQRRCLKHSPQRETGLHLPHSGQPRQILAVNTRKILCVLGNDL